MDDKLKLAVQTIYNALTTVWGNNGKIKAYEVRDNVVLNLSKITGESAEDIEKKVEHLIIESQ